MRIEYQVAAAFALDLLFGDPRSLPHPVRVIGEMALRLENPLRRRIVNQRAAGVCAALLIIGGAAFSAFALLALSSLVASWARDVMVVLLLYFCFAARDLADHASRVLRDLRAGDLVQARFHVSWMVGRDTATLDERGVVRAAVESVAENTVDGVIAPLFFALLCGPVAAIAYKAVSTLDSTFGYKNARYLHFGWASARFDDCLAYIPARLTLLVMPVASALVGLHPILAMRMGLRDGRKHASPNSGLSEASAAGALNVRLGGPLLRKGQPCVAPWLGDDGEPLAAHHIARVVRLMLATVLLFLVAGFCLRFFLI